MRETTKLYIYRIIWAGACTILWPQLWKSSKKQYLHEYYSGGHANVPQNKLASYIINRTFTECEIKCIIKKLKNNKSPGCDNLPSELIKECKESMSSDLCDLFNYMIEKREFPDIWAEGIRSAIYKAGAKLDPTNYRGITVLPVFSKIFEMAIHDRLMFVNEAFGILDKFNGGFLKGSRTADNIFILITLIHRQLMTG